MSDPIITLTLVGLAGLVVLNPKALTQALGLISGIITRTLQLASGASPKPTPRARGFWP